MKEGGEGKKAPPRRGSVFTFPVVWESSEPTRPTCRRGCRNWDGEKESPGREVGARRPGRSSGFALAGQMLRGMCDLSNDPIVRFRYCGISANWRRQTCIGCAKKGPAKAGPCTGNSRDGKHEGFPQQKNAGGGG